MKLLFFTLLCGVALASKVRYDNFKVYRSIPVNEAQLQALRDLEELNNAYSFWSDARGVNASVDVMVPPHLEQDFIEFTNLNQINTNVWIENVQDRIDNEKPKIQPKNFGFTSYHTLNEIYDWIDTLAARYPDVATIIAPGMSYEGRVIKGLHISFKQGNSHKGVFIEGGIHSREWISVATTCYILNEILSSEDPEIREMAERYDWYIFPVFNPDGYVYTHTTNRMWRKTRTPYGSCYGADANRNWGYRWNTGGASSNPCAETFAGPNAFSEVETLSMSQYISSIQNLLIGYIGFHSYSQMLLFPYGHTTANLDNYAELNEVGSAAVKSLAARFGTRYTYGNIAQTIYVATGSSMDWAAGTYGTRITYTYELRDLGQYGFILPPEQILPTGLETMDSIVTIMNEFHRKG